MRLLYVGHHAGDNGTPLPLLQLLSFPTSPHAPEKCLPEGPTLTWWNLSLLRSIHPSQSAAKLWRTPVDMRDDLGIVKFPFLIIF